jgi:hypothetical protein
MRNAFLVRQLQHAHLAKMSKEGSRFKHSSNPQLVAFGVSIAALFFKLIIIIIITTSKIHPGRSEFKYTHQARK